MAAITTTAITVGMSAYQIAQAEKQKKEAKRAMNEFERQDLDNSYESIDISTKGSDIVREESARTTAALTDAARNGGIRGVLGGIPQIQAFDTKQNREAAKLIDDQIIKREYAAAGDESRIRDIQERRDNEELAGIGQQMEVAEQNKWSGIRGVGNGLIYGASNINGGEGGGDSSNSDSYEKQFGNTKEFDTNLEIKSLTKGGI